MIFSRSSNEIDLDKFLQSLIYAIRKKDEIFLSLLMAPSLDIFSLFFAGISAYTKILISRFPLELVCLFHPPLNSGYRATRRCNRDSSFPRIWWKNDHLIWNLKLQKQRKDKRRSTIISRQNEGSTMGIPCTSRCFTNLQMFWTFLKNTAEFFCIPNFVWKVNNYTESCSL